MSMTATDHINQQAVASYVREAIWPGNMYPGKSVLKSKGGSIWFLTFENI